MIMSDAEEKMTKHPDLGTEK